MSVGELVLEKVPFEGVEILNLEEVTSLRKFFISHKAVDAAHYDQFLIKSFPLLIRSLKSATGVGNYRITCTDTIAIWILRTTQLCSKNSSFETEIGEILSLSDYPTFLFQYIVDYCNETGAPLSNSLRDVFTKLLTLLKRYSPQDLLQQWANVTLEISHERRVQYYLIEHLSKEIEQPDYFISRDPNFVDDVIHLMSSNALANPIGKAISSILKRLYVDEDHAEKWVETYWGPIKKGIKQPELRKGVEQYILPNIFKFSINAFKVFVKDLQNDVDLFITCLNIGQSLAIEEEPFPNLVSLETINRLIIKEDYKIKIFQLLTYSPKGSKPINFQIFEILKEKLDIFFVDCEVETRGEFLSLFKQFIFRVKDSAYALHRDGAKLQKKKIIQEAEIRLNEIAIAKSFFHWLLNFIKAQIHPGSQYQRVSTGFKILQMLADTGLDSSLTVKLDIHYPFSIQMFDDTFIRLFFDNILSTYDDIRKNAVSLLALSKVRLPDEQRLCLISKGQEMLNDYTRSESGSKILECLYLLSENDSLLEMLVAEIPLKTNIKEAVHTPVDGYFQSMGLILNRMNNYSKSDQIISIVENHWNSVREILSHDSPEGCDQYGVGSAQLVLSYAWRSTKESTILLQRLLDFDISTESLLKIGELVLDQLSTVRHRGAFSAVYPTFIKVASICKIKVPEQNKAWLDYNISLIQTKTQLITRRSGGLPFLITAIVTVEKDLLKYAFDKLLEIAETPVDEKAESENMDIAQVHAFNCIKTLFIESKLSDRVAPYIYEGLELALSTFSSKIWSVRNCSIMLFTALQNRLFGRKKISARVFFSRFKGIKEILIEILQNSITEGYLETLFPVLTILSKLEANPGYDGLDEFKPLLRVCLATKYWKIREAAARAMPALITNPEQESHSLLESVSSSNQNKLHGHLLAIRSLAVYDEELVNQLYNKLEDFLLSNICSATALVFVQNLSFALVKYPNYQLISKLREWFHENNQSYQIDGSKQLLMKEVFKLIKEDDETLLAEGLSSPFFEVQLEATEFCAQTKIDHPLLTKIANNDECWTYVRSKAIPLVKDFSLKKIFEFVEQQAQYGEDIKRSALELLGSIVAKSNNPKDYYAWYQIVTKNAHDDEPYQIRLAALKSVLSFIKEKKTAKVEWLLYDFLSDDDDEIRELASAYFDDNSIAWYNARTFAENFLKNDDSSTVVVQKVLSFQPTFKPFSENDKVLFYIEKTNFYRNRGELQAQLSQMVQKVTENISELELKTIKDHLISLGTNLVKVIEEKGYDGILGWSTDEEVFQDIYSVIYHLKALKLDTTTILGAAKSVKLHGYLIELLVTN